MVKANIFTKMNVTKVRIIFFWRAVGGSTISCVVNFFSLHRKTATAQQDPERLIDNLILCIFHDLKLSIKYKYPPSSIIAMGKTSVWNDMVSDTTVDKQVV